MGVKKISHNRIKEKLESTKKIIYKNEDLKIFLDLLHPEKSSKSYVRLLKIEERAKNQQWGISTDKLEMLHKFLFEEDFYKSVNEFYRPDKMTTKYLRKINAFYVDLDYYTEDAYKGLSAESIIYLLEQEVDMQKPSFYVDTGRGLHIYWLLEKTLATPKTKKYWRDIQKVLIDRFENFGVDTKVKDLARVLRNVGTTNSKSNEEVRLILNAPSISEVFRYKISDMACFYQDYLFDRKSFNEEKDKAIRKKEYEEKGREWGIQNAQKKKKKNKIVYLKNILSMHYNRAKDIEKLVEMRTGKSQEGIRMMIVFLYRLQLAMMSKSAEESLKLTIALNSKIIDGLDEKEIEESTAKAVFNGELYEYEKEKYTEEMGISLKTHLRESGVYLYNNSTIIEALKITEQEQVEMSILIGANEKIRRKNIRNKSYYQKNKEQYKYSKEKYNQKLEVKNKLSRNDKNEIIRQKIKKLLAKGLSQRAIAKKLKIGIAAVNRHSKKMKQETPLNISRILA